MGIDDPLLPAAVHLTGPFADDILRPAIERAGGNLTAHRCTQVHYRPGHDLIARYRAEVEWRNGRTRRETVLAATTAAGPPAGTLNVVAEHAGSELAVGVWRWPFDPELPALERSVRSTAEVLVGAGLTDRGAAVGVEVVAYRPTERAVLRVTAGESTWYLKIVTPAAAPQIVRRHRLLHEHGMPVPEVVADDPAQGWMLLSELPGPTLRDLIKQDAPRWIEPATLRSLVRELGGVDPDGLTAMRSRIADGPYHAALLSTVLPEHGDRLNRLRDHLEAEGSTARERPRGFVHGDLHERQLIVDDGRIVGLLDIDEAGRGDPIDDIAVPAAHLAHRSLTAPNGARIRTFVDDLVHSSGRDQAPHDIAVGTVAVLAGLATGPFRAQSARWREQIADVLDLIDATFPLD